MRRGRRADIAGRAERHARDDSPGGWKQRRRRTARHRQGGRTSVGINTAVDQASIGTEEIDLKATEPTLQAPIGGVEVLTLNPTLVLANSQNPFVGVSFNYVFALYEVTAAGLILVETATVAEMPNSTAHTVELQLNEGANYSWQARATLDGAFGPWSPMAQFITPIFVTLFPPTPLSPIDETVSSFRPDMSVTNGLTEGSPADIGTVVIEIEVATDINFSNVVETARTNTRAVGSTNIPLQHDLTASTQYYWHARSRNDDPGTTAIHDGAQGIVAVIGEWSATKTFFTPATQTFGGGGGSSFTPGGSPGAPFTTPPGNAPNLSHVIQGITSQFPGALANSCQEHGGNWELMDRFVEGLRVIDGRWAYNCKRGNCGDVSLDVVTYYRGSGSPHGSTNVQIFDVIGGHCGPNPSPSWNDVTGATQAAGTVGRSKYPR